MTAVGPAGPVMSVVIPAHNEEHTIARALSALLGEAGDGEFDVTVVCNGCRDGTARAARAFSPTVAVIETDVASKAVALNLGDAAAVTFPRLYLDADVCLATDGARALVTALSDPDVLAACPRRSFDLSGRSWVIRAYYCVWAEVPGVKGQILGAGAYALSAAGRARFDRFPQLQGDDYFIASLFDSSERRTEPAAETVISPPARLRDLIRTRKRVMAGNVAVRRTTGRAVQADSGDGDVPDGAPGGRSGRTWWRQGIDNPRLIPHVLVYGGVNLTAKLWAAAERSRGREAAWERDDRTRDQQPGGDRSPGSAAAVSGGTGPAAPPAARLG